MEKLRQKIRAFAAERGWEKFHSPKNLSMALMVETGELMEHFMWLSEDGSRSLDDDRRAAVADEIGDVLIYLTNLADQLDIDPVQAAHEKLVKAGKKYPADGRKGEFTKR